MLFYKIVDEESFKEDAIYFGDLNDLIVSFINSEDLWGILYHALSGIDMQFDDIYQHITDTLDILYEFDLEDVYDRWLIIRKELWSRY